MQTWVINMILLSLICHGCFAGAIRIMMNVEAKKRGKAKAG